MTEDEGSEWIALLALDSNVGELQGGEGENDLEVAPRRAGAPLPGPGERESREGSLQGFN